MWPRRLGGRGRAWITRQLSSPACKEIYQRHQANPSVLTTTPCAFRSNWLLHPLMYAGLGRLPLLKGPWSEAPSLFISLILVSPNGPSSCVSALIRILLYYNGPQKGAAETGTYRAGSHYCLGHNALRRPPETSKSFDTSSMCDRIHFKV